MPQTLYFIRHGQTDWNAERRMQGQWESDLSPLGRAQALQNARDIAALGGVDAIYASPLGRAHHSAVVLASEVRCPVRTEDRLKEWSAGDWSGVLYAEIMTRWPEAWKAWRENMWDYRPPGAENFVDLEIRGGAFLTERLLPDERNRIAIVSHGFIGRVLMGILLKLDPAAVLRIHQENDTFFRLTRDGAQWRAERFEAGEGPLDGVFQSAPDRVVETIA